MDNVEAPATPELVSVPQDTTALLSLAATSESQILDLSTQLANRD